MQLGNNTTRRIVLAGLASGLATTTITGQASGRKPTVIADSPSCGSLRVAYNGDGPPLTVQTDGPETPTITLTPSETTSVSVPAGEYTLTAFPQNANQTARRAISVEGTPVTVADCLPPGITAEFECVDEDDGLLTFENPLDHCVAIRFEAYLDGELRSSGRAPIAAGETRPFTAHYHQYDEWYFWAHLPISADRCLPSDETVPINGQPSPLHFAGTSCSTDQIG